MATVTAVADPAYTVAGTYKDGKNHLVKLEKEGLPSPGGRWWPMTAAPSSRKPLSMTKTAEGKTLYNGEPKEAKKFFQVGHASKIIVDGKEVKKTGALGPFEFLATSSGPKSCALPKKLSRTATTRSPSGTRTSLPAKDIMRPGPEIQGDEGHFMSRLDFISLMLALFFGTSALPHILIRYYTVPSPQAARKSTIVAIAAIGFFYVLTLLHGDSGR